MQQKNKQLIDAVAPRLKDFPLYSQEDSAGNPMIAARLFNAAGSGTWYLSEFDGTRIAFGYVTGLGDDEWDYIDLEEMAAIQIAGWHCIEVDLHFTPCRFLDLPPSA